MARLLAVNVGLPQDVPWQRQDRAHRRYGRQPSPDRGWPGGSTSTATGREIWPGTAASSAPCWSTRSTPTATGSKQLGRDDFVYGQFGENFTVDGLAGRRGVHRRPVPDRRRAVRGHPAAGHLLPGGPADGRAPDGRPARVPPAARLLPPGPRPRARCEAGDEIVKVASGPEAMTVAEIDALLYLPGHPRDQARPGAADPRAQPGLEGLPAGAARPGRRRAGRPRATPG